MVAIFNRRPEASSISSAETLPARRRRPRPGFAKLCLNACLTGISICHRPADPAPPGPTPVCEPPGSGPETMRGLGGRTEPRVYEYHRAAWLSKNPGGKASRAEADVQYFKATRRIYRCEDSLGDQFSHVAACCSDVRSNWLRPGVSFRRPASAR